MSHDEIAPGAFAPVLTALPGDTAAILLTFLIRCHERDSAPAGFLMRSLRQRLESSEDASLVAARMALVEPAASFLDDIIAPAFRADTVPLLLLAQSADQPAPVLELRWPQSLRYSAEGGEQPIPGLERLAAPLRLAWRDSFALFGSGHLAYSVALATAPDSPRSMSEIDLLLLQKFADMTEDVVAGGGDEAARPLSRLNCFSLNGANPGSLLDCVRNRAMALHHDPVGEPLRRIFACAELAPDAWEPRDWDYGNLCGGVVHVDGMIIPADTSWSGDAALALAGLTQNILDFQFQDEAEMADSLQPIFQDGEQVQIFAHSRLIHEFSHRSRSFGKMAELLGVCPYLMLSHLVLTYDERLLAESEALLAGIVYGKAEGDSVRVRPLAPLFRLLERAGRPASQQFAESLQRRLEIFRELDFPYIENVFRYRTEQRIYAGVDQMRGLSLRRARFKDVLEQYKNAVRDIHDYSDLTSQRRIGIILLGLSLLSVLGFLKDMQQIFLLPSEWLSSQAMTWGLRGLAILAFLLFLGIVGWGLWLLLRRGPDEGGKPRQ